MQGLELRWVQGLHCGIADYTTFPEVNMQSASAMVMLHHYLEGQGELAGQFTTHVVDTVALVIPTSPCLAYYVPLTLSPEPLDRLSKQYSRIEAVLNENELAAGVKTALLDMQRLSGRGFRVGI